MLRSISEKGYAMKLIAVAALAVLCVILLMGQDDIRRFLRMRNM